VDLRPFPPEVLKLLKRLSREVIEERAAADASFRKVYDSFRKFEQSVAKWTRIGDQAMLATRDF
jgi:TRAP-type mannitol/chloroaromatic compound transport system substrate-binding protein